MVVAHGHPDHTKGGGEIAAYNLHRQLQSSSSFESVFFARHHLRDLIHGGTPSAGTGREKEIIMYANMPDWFRFSQPDKALVWRDFRQTLETCKPQIVHFHHYLHLGLELIREVRNFNPDIRIVLTLHEYYGICHNQGQMVKTDRTLCYESSPNACARCFSQYTAPDFMLRKLFIKSHFDLIDAFVSPSQFLKDRYVAWGLQQDKIEVIENLLESTPAANNSQPAADVSYDSSDRTRFAFFGQINWFKGLDLLLDAIDMLPTSIKQRIQIDVNGSGLEHQPKSLQDSIQQQMNTHSKLVKFRGPYTQEELPQLMSEYDWMVVPSKWWENSPMVILEASKHGLPVICSNIGGMSEKITHGKTGLHFQARRADSLAKALIWAAENKDKQPEYATAIKNRYEPGKPLHQHIGIYNALTQSDQAVSLTDLKDAA